MLQFRESHIDDLEVLVEIENACFQTDKLSRRRFRHWINAENGLLHVATEDDVIVGYGLVLLVKGTRLARLYSLATQPALRGKGIAKKLLAHLENCAADAGKLYMRLEVAINNNQAIALYESSGYRSFAEYTDYYEDHTNALRMQKCVRQNFIPSAPWRQVWYQQTTDFTCGPASLMMAMASQDPGIHANQDLELDLWRESTTIFMTSGHGGCHPLGLAISARDRGFEAIAYTNKTGPLFLDSVRSEYKKSILTKVHEQFLARARNKGVKIVYADVSQKIIENWMKKNYSVLILISTYRLDGRKAPHWVSVTGMDELCLYVHDPDIDEPHQIAMDCQHMPIARDDFDKMATFGSTLLRTAIAIRKI